MVMSGKPKALEKIKSARVEFNLGEYINAVSLLDDAADFLKQSGEWRDDDICATIIALRRRMSDKVIDSERP